jgi:hypothetical protein
MMEYIHSKKYEKILKRIRTTAGKNRVPTRHSQSFYCRCTSFRLLSERKYGRSYDRDGKSRKYFLRSRDY